MLPPDPRQFALHRLTEHLAGLLRPSSSDLPTQAALEGAALRPTETAAYFAAQAAVNTLLAFDAGAGTPAIIRTVPGSVAPVTALPAPSAPPPAARRPRSRPAPKASGAGPQRTPAPRSARPPKPAAQTYKCPYCPKTYQQAARIEPHIRKLHPGAAIPSR